jgi:protein ImuA
MGIPRSQATKRLVEALRARMAQWEGSRWQPGETPVSTGSPPIDALLPGRGFRRGTLVEWLSAGEGGGAESLALVAAQEACREGGALVILDRHREFYPPEAIRRGIDPEGLIVLQAASQADNLWALDQALRCPAVAAALAWPEKLDPKTFRRLQLAVEQGGGLGLLLRPDEVRHEPSWADVRLWVQPLPSGGPGTGRRLSVQLLRSRQGGGGGSVEVEFDDETHAVHLAPQLARPADPRRAAGA